jgi:hypothetical protein
MIVENFIFSKVTTDESKSLKKLSNILEWLDKCCFYPKSTYLCIFISTLKEDFNSFLFC